jgi:type IV pilus assembly protein PilM
VGLFVRDTNYFGLDIGSSSIRLVQLRPSSGRLSLVAYGSIEMPPGLFESDSKLDHKSVSDLVRRLVKESKISTKNSVVALPGSVAFTTVIRMPKMSKSETGKAISYQAEQYIPMPLNEVKLDWHIIEATKDGKQQEVLIVAAPIRSIQKYVSIVEGAGLELQALEVNPIAEARSIVPNTMTEVVIVDVGRTSTDISIISQGIVRHIRSIPTAGQAFTRAIEHGLQVDENQAEQFKIKFGMAQDKLDGSLFRALQGVVDSISTEVQRSLKYYNSDLGGAEVKNLILTGRSSAMPELNLYLAKSLNIAVQMANPWVHVSYPQAIQQQIEALSLEYGVAVGLAMRGRI